MLLFNYTFMFTACRLVNESVLEVEATLILPSSGQFPLEYKYYVCLNSRKQDCYEYLSHPASNGIVNRYIFSKDHLLQGSKGVYEKVA